MLQFPSINRLPTVSADRGSGGVPGARLEVICRAIRNSDSGADTVPANGCPVEARLYNLLARTLEESVEFITLFNKN